MRVALLADVHGNLAAFEAVLEFLRGWRPDHTIMAGDVLNRGPRPAECLARTLEGKAAGWLVLRGNHEDYVLRESRPPADRPDWERKLCRHTAWTLERIPGALDELAAWPESIDLPGPDDTRLRFWHASRAGNRAGLYAQMTPRELDERVETDCDVFGVGHTHVPFIRRHGRALVVNAGAVGMPFDRDPRASIALLEHRDGAWQVQIERIAYDRARTERDFHASGYLADGGPVTPLIFHEFQHARPMLGEWHRLFEHLVREERVTIEDSVAEMLKAP